MAYAFVMNYNVYNYFNITHERFEIRVYEKY